MNPIISLCIMKDTPMVSYSTWDEDTQGKIEVGCEVCGNEKHKHGHHLSLIHISEPTRPQQLSRMPSSA